MRGFFSIYGNEKVPVSSTDGEIIMHWLRLHSSLLQTKMAKHEDFFMEVNNVQLKLHQKENTTKQSRQLTPAVSNPRQISSNPFNSYWNNNCTP